MMAIIARRTPAKTVRQRGEAELSAMAEKRRFPTARAVERYRLTAARREARERERQAMLARVFRILLEDLESARQDEHLAAGTFLGAEVAAP